MIDVNVQSSIKIKEEKILYFDPIKREKTEDADYIFITHTHWDHFDKETILNIKKDSTKIIGPKDMKSTCEEMGFAPKNIIIVEPNHTYSFNHLKIQTVPAYNKNKDFHPKENGWVGYVIKINDVTYYIPGDTDALEENEKIKCDIAFIPIGGTYTMNAKEAAEFINKIAPKKVIPIHYNMVVGSKKDEEIFIENVDKKVEVKIVL